MWLTIMNNMNNMYNMNNMNNMDNNNYNSNAKYLFVYLNTELAKAVRLSATLSL